MRYTEAVEYIENIPKFTSKNSIEHTKRFLYELGINQKEKAEGIQYNPENDVKCTKDKEIKENTIPDRIKVIHIAGTNGKGTVTAMLSNVLVKCKKRTGMFTSPHLVKINERIRINNKEITDDEFTEAFNEVKKVTDKMKNENYPHPSYFEFLFLMAMWKFNKENVEYVVLETGLGGRLDATNSVISPYLTIITSIGMDHMEYLGDTIDKIAGEKAGIIKENVPVIYWGENEIVSDVIERKACEVGAETTKVLKENYKIIRKSNKSVDFSMVSEYYLNDIFSVPFISEYQVQNAVVAIKAIECMEEIRHMKQCVKEGISSVCWEGRMEAVMAGVILDGAHNGPGIDEFIKTFEEYVCSGNKNILFSVVKDKDYEYMVSKLSGTDVSKVYITRINSDRGLETDKIYDDFRKYGCKAEIVINEDIDASFRQAVNDKKDDDVLFCVGSLYLVGEIKRILKKDTA